MREFYNTYYHRLFNYVRKYVDNTQEAEDIVIKSFTKYFKVFPDTYKDNKSYLYKIATNLSLNCIRDIGDKKQKAKLYCRCWEEEEEPTVFEVDNEVVALLYKSIESLTPREKEIIKLMLRGAETSEIARKLGITMAGVRSQKRDAIKLLKQKICKKRQ